jgi:hypothetical protein
MTTKIAPADSIDARTCVLSAIQAAREGRADEFFGYFDAHVES